MRDRFIVSAPVSGRVLRIELEPGDRVKRGQVVARVRAEAPPLLDARTRAEAEAAVESARAALGRARAEEQRAKATLDQARRDLTRVRAAGRRAHRRQAGARGARGGRPCRPGNRQCRGVRGSRGRVGAAAGGGAAGAVDARGARPGGERDGAGRGRRAQTPSRKRDGRAGGRSARRDRRPGPPGNRGGPAVHGCGPHEGRCPSDRRAMGRRETAGGARPTDRAGGLHEDLGARRRRAARERRARLRRVVTRRQGVAGRRLSSRGPCGHLGIAKCREGADERVVPPRRAMGRVRGRTAAARGGPSSSWDIRRVSTPK